MFTQSIPGGTVQAAGSQEKTRQKQLPVVEKEAKNPFHIDGAEKSFQDYMKKTIAERMEDAWLASHRLTREELEAMPPEQRDAIKKQMAEDIKQRLEKETQNKQVGPLKG